MLRISPLLEYASTTLLVMAFVGAVTAVFAATSGLVQNDIKRVIAYSTASQMGYLFMALGLGNFSLALYHLANHACFKALLFMAAGAIIHGFGDQQDMRRYGGLSTVLPFVYTALLIGSLSLMALPYLTGWYSKDGILEVALGSFSISGSVVYGLGTLVAGITAFYSVRLIALTFYGYAAAPGSYYANAHEASVYVIVPLVVLSLFAVGLGYLSSDLFRGLGSDFISGTSPMHVSSLSAVDAEFGVPTALKLLPAIATLAGSVASYVIYTSTPKVGWGHALISHVLGSRYVLGVYRFLSYQWHFDAFIIRTVITPSLVIGHSLSKVLDRGVLEAVGPYGLQHAMLLSGRQTSYYSTEVLTDYATYIVLGLLAFMLLAHLWWAAGAITLGGSSWLLGTPTLVGVLMGVNLVSLAMATDTSGR